MGLIIIIKNCKLIFFVIRQGSIIKFIFSKPVNREAFGKYNLRLSLTVNMQTVSSE